ncbi:uncharacterized protein BDV14DRAFT_194439 [Aspergillus stella-maris]|uniref:uncharacterized protein n=1 Tax=Aspergillus stella-maris TaxID=1810926 RepID=UPI003CCDD231
MYKGPESSTRTDQTLIHHHIPKQLLQDAHKHLQVLFEPKITILFFTLLNRGVKKAATKVAEMFYNAGIASIMFGWTAIGLVGSDLGFDDIRFVIHAAIQAAINNGYTRYTDTENCPEFQENRMSDTAEPYESRDELFDISEAMAKHEEGAQN